jgi:hypothetical protein
MVKLLNLMMGFVGMTGLILCPPPNTSTLKNSTVVSDSSEQFALKNALPNRVNATEPLNFPESSSQLTNLSITNQRHEVKRDAVSFSLWSPAKETALSDQSNSLGDADIIRFQQIMQYADSQSLHDRPMGEIVQAIAYQLLGSPYKANLLDQSSKEKLVVSLTQFDCVLFVETVLALARGVAVQDYSYQSFADHLQQQRYRDSKLNDYCSRLHYFSEWIDDNQKRGNLLNIVNELGGVSFPKVLDFMSTHRSSYPPIAHDDTTYRCVQQMESSLNPFTIHYIPESEISQIYSRLKPGDVVAIATDIPGLDVTHTGLVYRNSDGSIGLIHAAPGSGVKVSPDLQRYVSQVGNQIGILVTRPIDPRSRLSKL